MGMNPNHHMLLDKLKGHSYSMTPWQYLDVMQHYDAELSYILQCSIEMFREENALTTIGKNGKFYPYELFKTVGVAIFKTVFEREGVELAYPRDACIRIAEKMFASYNTFVERGGSLDKGEIALAEEFIIYGINDAIIQARYFKK